MRHTRYQGAIVRDDHILLIQHRAHRGEAAWLLPGGGQEVGESEEECVAREMQEETGLDVRVVRLILEEPDMVGGSYQWRKTYLCEIVAGEPSPGFEPEPEAAAAYSITAVGWFDLRAPALWPALILNDPITLLQLQSVLAALGYREAPGL